MTSNQYSELEPAALVELAVAVGQWLGAESAPVDVIHAQERVVEWAQRLQEQLEAKERLLDLASEMGHSLEEQLEAAIRALADAEMIIESRTGKGSWVGSLVLDRLRGSNPASSPRAGELLWFPLEEGQEPPVGWSKHPDGKHAWRIADGTEPSPASRPLNAPLGTSMPFAEEPNQESKP